MAPETKIKTRNFQLCGQASHMVQAPGSKTWFTCKDGGNIEVRDARDFPFFEGLEQYYEVRNVGTSKEPDWQILEDQPGYVRPGFTPSKPKSYNVVGKDGKIRQVNDSGYQPNKDELEAARKRSLAATVTMSSRLSDESKTPAGPSPKQAVVAVTKAPAKKKVAKKATKKASKKATSKK